MKTYSFKDCEGAIEMPPAPHEGKGITFSEMCGVIERAKILKKRDGTHPTAREIWESSPTGELLHLYGWYAEAVWVIGWREDEIMLDMNEKLAAGGL